MNRRERQRKKARNDGSRERKPVVLVYCEGEVTERVYLEGFARAHRASRLEVQIAKQIGGPKRLVELASREKKLAEKRAKVEQDDNAAYDAVWCVFDIDDHKLVEEAKQQATANGVKLAISNPNFELWPLLHFRENPGMQRGDQMAALLKAHIPGYEKRVEFGQVAHGYSKAVERAMRMDRIAEANNESGRNPTTGVYRLTESIRSGAYAAE